MIKYFATEAAYAAAVKSSFESQIAIVGESNEAKFDGRNVIVGIKSAKTGAIAVLDGNSALHFVMPGTYNSGSFMSNYTIVGVVAIGVNHPDYRGQIGLLRKNFSSKQASYIYSYRLTGYTLDGAQHTGVLSIRGAGDGWAANVDYTITYTASNVDQLISQLNTYFRANAPFTTQDWVAVKNGNNIDLVFHYEAWQQSSYNTGKSGFTLEANLLPELASTSNMLRKNGQRSGEGTITNWDRALAYYRNDNGTSAYQGGRTSDQGSNVKQTYPINLPTWLGTSTKNPGDFCAGLRAIYGEGEAGWLKFMETFLPVRPTKYGIVGDKETYGDGMRNTYLMAGKTFTKQNGTVVAAHPAADDCANTTFNHKAMGKGKWFMADMDQVFSVLKTIKYGTNGSRKADPINEALEAIGSPALSNGSNVWASSRCGARSFWYANGGGGCAGYGSLYTSCLALPLLLLDVAEGAN